MKKIVIRVTKRHIIVVLLFIIVAILPSLLFVLVDRLSFLADAVKAKRVIKTAIYSIGTTFLIAILAERRFRQLLRRSGWVQLSFLLIRMAVVMFFIMWFFDLEFLR